MAASPAGNQDAAAGKAEAPEGLGRGLGSGAPRTLWPRGRPTSSRVGKREKMDGKIDLRTKTKYGKKSSKRAKTKRDRLEVHSRNNFLSLGSKRRTELREWLYDGERKHNQDKTKPTNPAGGPLDERARHHATPIGGLFYASLWDRGLNCVPSLWTTAPADVPERPSRRSASSGSAFRAVMGGRERGPKRAGGPGPGNEALTTLWSSVG